MPLNLKLLFCGVILEASTASAQAVLGGQAVDSLSGSPLAGIVVFARSATGKNEAKTLTDDRGLFDILIPKDGAYQLVFAKQCRHLLFGPVDTLAGNTRIERKYLLTFTAFPRDSVYADSSVETPVKPKFTFERPFYPRQAEAAGRSGRVQLEFVIDTTGKPEMSTLRILSSTDLEFAASVIHFLPGAEYYPAAVCGHHVRQLVKQDFQFKVPF